MHSLLALITLLPATVPVPDPRNVGNYHVLFDLEARGKTELVNGYGAYVQVYEDGGSEFIRYCENFEGHSTSGRPNPNRQRYKLLPFGVVDDTAYHCRDFTPDDVAIGQPLIEMGSKKFFAMKSAGWTVKDGGEILFQFAQKIPLLGAPKYKTLRIRASRKSSAVDYVVETILPRAGVIPSHFFLYDVSTSGLSLPNGIDSLTVDPNESTRQTIDIDGLEGPIEVLGDGESSRIP